MVSSEGKTLSGSERTSTGSEDLDGILGGGLEPGVITQIYGGPGCGKSTLCIIAAITCIRSGRPVIWIDTEGLSIERFAQLAGDDAGSLADDLYIFEPKDFREQGVVIRDIERLLQNLPQPAGLLVMDSATALYRTELDSGRAALRTLSHQMVKLLGLSRKFKIPVLITNQVYMDPESGAFHPLGGTVLAHLSKCILRIEKRDGQRRAVLEKHRSLPEGRDFYFEIGASGIISSGYHHGIR
ncbi:MAG: DNA repair and recombination protein RadB [Methanoculleaceae archaeon]